MNAHALMHFGMPPADFPIVFATESATVVKYVCQCVGQYVGQSFGQYFGQYVYQHIVLFIIVYCFVCHWDRCFLSSAGWCVQPEVIVTRACDSGGILRLFVCMKTVGGA